VYLRAWDKDLERNIHILLECGTVQGKSIVENFSANSTLMDKIDAKNIDFVIISHVNLDHFGMVSGLVAKGFKGRILMSKESKALGIPMLYDSAHINEKEVEYLNKSKKVKGKNYKPHYTSVDVERTIDLIDIVPLEEMYKLTPNIEVRFLPNRHLAGAISFTLHFKDLSSRVHKLYYSGDLGNTSFGKHFVYDTQKPTNSANVYLVESTYGSREKMFVDKNLRKRELKELEKTIEDTILNKHGCVLMPAFSLDRTENLLINLKRILDNNEAIKNTPVVLDGKLSNTILDVYEKICEGVNKEEIDEILQWDNLIRIREYKDTEKMLNECDGKIILSSSGMANNGRILNYLKRLLPYKRHTIVFSGFASSNTNAYKIKNKEQTGQKTLKVDNTICLMNSEVLVMDSFSSHIQRENLLNFIKKTNVSETVFLIHGETNGREELKEDLEKMYEDECVSTKVVIPKKNQVIYF
jgi:metallo-beta-lactamase family protein